MIDLILSLLGGLPGAIMGLLALAGGLFGLWFKRKAARQAERLEQQDRAIGAYKVKEEVHRHDQEVSVDTDKKINALHERIDAAESGEEAAKIAAEELDGYFGPLGRKD